MMLFRCWGKNVRVKSRNRNNPEQVVNNRRIGVWRLIWCLLRWQFAPGYTFEVTFDGDNVPD